MSAPQLFDTGGPPPVRRLEACPACGGPLVDKREHREGRCVRCIALGAVASMIDDVLEEDVPTFQVIDCFGRDLGTIR